MRWMPITEDENWLAHTNLALAHLLHRQPGDLVAQFARTWIWPFADDGYTARREYESVLMTCHPRKGGSWAETGAGWYATAGRRYNKYR